MSANIEGLTSVDFDHGWKCYYQNRTDQTPVSVTNSDQRWFPVDLPHVVDINIPDTDAGKWWYLKRFQWPATCHPSEDKIYLDFTTSIDRTKISDIHGNIWLNGRELFSGSLSSLTELMAVSPKLLRREYKRGNALVLCSVNSTLALHLRLRIDAKMLCATGQVMMDEKRNIQHISDYTVSVDDADGRIGLVFNPKLKTQSARAPPVQYDSPSVLDEEKIYTKALEDLPVPRLVIVMLAIGLRDDVQTFIALGRALRNVGHRVRLATHETFRSFVLGYGLEFYPLAGDPADPMPFMVRSTSIVPSMRSILEGNIGKGRHALADMLASTWSACTANDDQTQALFVAEAIIANPLALGHIHCAEKLQIPLHIMSTLPCTPSVQFAHPLANVDDSIGSKEKTNLYSYDVLEMLTWTGMRDAVNYFRKNILGLHELHTRHAINVLIDERVPHTYCWSPSLIAKPKDWGAHMNVCGFLFLDDGAAYTSPPDDLLKFLGINADGTYIEPCTLPQPIYIHFRPMTDYDSPRLLRVVLDAVRQTGYRILLCGLATDADRLPANVFRIGEVPPEWLFQYVSAVCHCGEAGTTANGLRAGKPMITVPFSSGQFFWGNVIERSGAGPPSLPARSVTASQLAEAFRFVHLSSTRTAAERLREAILKEDGCTAAVDAFHANLPLARMHSDLEPTFAACFYLEKYHVQISRPVAQVLVTAGALEETDLRPHITREWQLARDDRKHLLNHGVVEHSQKDIWNLFTDAHEELTGAADNDHSTEGSGSEANSFGHLRTIPCSDRKGRQQSHVADHKSSVSMAGLTVPAIDDADASPAVLMPSPITRSNQDTCASTNKTVEIYHKERRRTSPKLFERATISEQRQNDDRRSFSTSVERAAARSGFHPRVCQYILEEFKQINREHNQRTLVSTSSENSLLDSISKK